MTSTWSDCRIYKGTIGIMSTRETNKLDALVGILHADLRRIFADRLLLSPAMPMISNMKWLGISLDDYECTIPKQELESGTDADTTIDGADSITTPNFDRPEEGSEKDSPLYSKPEEAHDKESVIPVEDSSLNSKTFGVVSGITVFVFLSVFFLAKERRRISYIFRPKRRRILWDEFFETPEYVGTGDPPTSYHFGRYHYLLHGHQYLSTQCESCVETLRQNLFESCSASSSAESTSASEAPMFYSESIFRHDGHASVTFGSPDVADRKCERTDDDNEVTLTSRIHHLENSWNKRARRQRSQLFKQSRYVDLADESDPVDAEEFSLVSLTTSEDTGSCVHQSTSMNTGQVEEVLFERRHSPRHII